MKIIVQRAKDAKVEVANEVVGSIDHGLMLLVGFTDGDTNSEIDWMINKVINLRIFDDDNGVMNKSLLDINGEVLSISQFTLYADTKKGNRPSYIKAMENSKAKEMYEIFNKKLSEYCKVETGIFGADMKVSFTNDGPVTIILEK